MWGPARPPRLKCSLQAWKPPPPTWQRSPHPLREAACRPGSHQVHLLKFTLKSVSAPTRRGRGRRQGHAPLPAGLSQDVPPHAAVPRSPGAVSSEPTGWGAGRQDEGTLLCPLSTCSPVRAGACWGGVVLGPDAAGHKWGSDHVLRTYQVLGALARWTLLPQTRREQVFHTQQVGRSRGRAGQPRPLCCPQARPGCLPVPWCLRVYSAANVLGKLPQRSSCEGIPGPSVLEQAGPGGRRAALREQGTPREL